MTASLPRYKASALAAFAEVDDGGVILHMGTKRYFSLNATGAAAWKLLERGSTAEELVAAFVDRYEVSAGEACAALEPLLAEMVHEDLLEAVEAP